MMATFFFGMFQQQQQKCFVFIFISFFSAAVGWLKTEDGQVAMKYVIIIRAVTMSEKYFSHHILHHCLRNHSLLFRCLLMTENKSSSPDKTVQLTAEVTAQFASWLGYTFHLELYQDSAGRSGS